jgi:hypothetical protein
VTSDEAIRDVSAAADANGRMIGHFEVMDALEIVPVEVRFIVIRGEQMLVLVMLEQAIES